MARPFGGVRSKGAWWQAYYPGPTGKRVYERTRFATAEDARAWLDDLAAARDAGSWLDPAAATERLAEYAVSWLRSHPVAPGTRELYAQLLDTHIIPTIGALQLRELNPRLIRQWNAELRERTGLTAARNAYKLLRQITAVAVTDGALAQNPVPPRGEPEPRRRPRIVPTLRQVRSIAARMPKRYRALVLLAVASGGRYGELVALRRCDLDLRKCTVTYERAWRRGRFDVTKRPASDRTVHIPQAMVGILEVHMKLFVTDAPDALLFATRNGAPPANNHVNLWLRGAAAELGLEGLTFHSFRHAAATLTAQLGATDRELMRRMGHTTARAAQIYQHATDSRDAAIAKRLDKVLKSADEETPLRMRG